MSALWVDATCRVGESGDMLPQSKICKVFPHNKNHSYPCIQISVHFLLYFTVVGFHGERSAMERSFFTSLAQAAAPNYRLSHDLRSTIFSTRLGRPAF